MRFFAIFLGLLFSFSVSASTDKSILGFSPEDAADQFQLEARFDELYSTENVAVDKQILILASVLNKYASQIDAATKILDQ